MSIRMAQIVETGFGASNLFHNRLESLVHGGCGKVVPHFIREYETAVLPAFTIAEPVLQLLVLHPAEC